MVQPLKHIHWLTETKEKLATNDGSPICVIEFCHQNNDEILSAWAKHFRNHYCLDSEIDILRDGTACSRKEYLINYKFPTDCRGFGPGIRAGDFGEILVADYLEYLLGYWVPRTRYDRKTIRDESTKGSDVIGFKFIGDEESPDDTLIIFEAKTQFSGRSPEPRLQDAVNDSIKDEIRKAESLNAIKQRLVDKRSMDASKIKRFQNPVDKPYKERLGAVALFSAEFYSQQEIIKTTVSRHPGKGNLTLIVIRGKDFMALVHELYERAANEA